MIGVVLTAYFPGEGAAAEPPQDVVDWTKIPTTTSALNVKREVLANLKGDTLDLGGGEIVLTPKVKLTDAAVDHVKMNLTITVEEAGQTVEFKNMVGVTGYYMPSGANTRNISIDKSPHTETFLRKGILTLIFKRPNTKPAGSGFAESLAEYKKEKERQKENPPQWKPFPGQPEPDQPKNKPAASPLLPGPESGYKPRSIEFARLAAAVSNKYEMPGRNTLRDYAIQWKEVAEAADKYPAPELHKYSSKMLERAKTDATTDLRTVRANLLKEADELANQKLGPGTLLGYETIDSFGNQRPVLSRGNEPDPAALARAQELRVAAALSDPKLKEWLEGQRNRNGWEDLLLGDGVSNNRDHLFQNVVDEARKILTAEAAKHAGKKSETPVVQFRRIDSTKFKVKNTSGRQLTDALVNLSLGFTKSDKLKQFGSPVMLFVPVWKTGEELEMVFEFKEPTVVHAKVDAYANETSSLGTEFSLIDPKSPPLQEPGSIVLWSRYPVEKGMLAWVEVDGKRVEWEVGQKEVRIPADPGEHKVVVRVRIKQKPTKILLESTIRLDAGEDHRIEVKNQKPV